MMEFLELSWDNLDDVEKFFKKMDSREVTKEVSLVGDVSFIACTPVPMEEYKIIIVGCNFSANGEVKNL